MKFFSRRRPFDHDATKHGHWYVTVEQGDRGDNVNIAEERFAHNGQHARREEGTTLVLTAQEAMWLHEQLSKLIRDGRL